MFPETGQMLGPYEILDELGGGGMARVLRGWDGRLRREVAIKVVHDRYDMPDIGERFLREARAVSGLNHPNICTIFDIGEQNETSYLVMELLEGQTLKERISESAMPVDEILRFGAEIADALSAAHARGIIHRDIKPANIFLVKKPSGLTGAKVLDFGLAYASEEREFGAHLTTHGATVGTVSYMSPEQARGEKLDPRSDLFSLGIVLYEMATGELPFKGNTSALVFVQLLGEAAPEPIRKLNGQIPDDLEQVIHKLLEKVPRERFQSATELCDELQALAEKNSSWLPRLKKAPPSMDVSSMLEQGRSIGEIDDQARPQPSGDPNAQTSLANDPVSAQVSSMYERVTSGPSGIRPVRTSIASKPRMSFPAMAPYTGQSSMHRAAAAPAQPAPAATPEQSEVDLAYGDPLAKERIPGRSSWKRTNLRWAVPVSALIAIAGALLAWSFGWL